MTQMGDLVGKVFHSRSRGPLDLPGLAAEIGVAGVAAAARASSPSTGLLAGGVLPRASGSGVVAGYAVTAWSPAGCNTMTWLAIDAAEHGSLLVLTSPDDTVAQWGELAAVSAKARGIAGVVIAGATRDVGPCRLLDVSVWARTVNPAEGSKTQPGYVNAPVDLLGALVRPGDLIVGDDDGVVVVRSESCAEVVAWATSGRAAEMDQRARLANGSVTEQIARKLQDLPIEHVDGP